MEDKTNIAALNSLLVGFELLECLDAIKETALYRQSLKQKINSLLPELESHVNKVEVLFGENEQSMFELLEGKKDLMKKIALFRPEYKSGFAEIINQFVNAPELTMHRLGIYIKGK